MDVEQLAVQLANVVRSGSNANGSWVKLGDGTMMQWGQVTETGSVTVRTYPVAFFSSAIVMTVSNIPFATNNWAQAWHDGSDDLGHFHSQGSTNGNVTQWFAIGRWK